MSSSQFSQPLQANPAIAVLGVPIKDEKLKASEDVAALGLSMLRVAPFNVNPQAIPDYCQIGYGDYIHNFAAFTYSLVMRQKTTNGSPGYLITREDIMDPAAKVKLLPFSPPTTLMSFDRVINADEAATIRARLGNVQTMSAMGRQSFLWKPADWDVVPILKELTPLKIVTAPRDFLNPSALVSLRYIIALLSAALHTHRYPAFTDREHLLNIQGIGLTDLKASEDEAMDVDNTTGVVEDVFLGQQVDLFGQKPVITRTNRRLLIDMSYDFDQREPGDAYIDGSKLVNSLPNTDGLLCPYFSALTQDDTALVPEFLETILAKNLGDNIEEVIKTSRYYRGEWGVIGRTEVGRQITHMVFWFRVALRAQARCLPIFTNDSYQGCVLSGAGFSVELYSKVYRPVSYGDLVTACPLMGVHQIALDKIIERVEGAGAKAMIARCKSMWELHVCLIGSRIKATDEDAILKAAEGLAFPDEPKHWGINLTTLKEAIDLIRLPMPLTIENKLPIHRSMLLSTDKLSLVVSSFGGHAPSFKVPGGKKFHLSEEMTFTQISGQGKAKQDVTRRLVRVAVHDKPLDQAIRDWTWVMENKSIDNPLVVAKVKRSELNRNKSFVGEDGVKLLALLRDLVGIDIGLSKVQKRKDRDDDEGAEGAVRKRRAVDDW